MPDTPSNPASQTWCRDDLFRNPQFQRLAWSVARGYRKYLSNDVLEECVGEGLKRAARWFNPEAPGAVRFTTAVCRCTHSACKNALDKERRYATRAYAGALRKEALDRFRQTATEEVEAMDQLAAVRGRVAAVLMELPPDYAQVLRLHFFDGKTPKEIAKALSLTPDFVRRKLNTALALAKNAAEAAGSVSP